MVEHLSPLVTDPRRSRRTRSAVVPILLATLAAGVLLSRDAAWGEEQKILGSGLERYDWFGEAVDIHQDRLIVGAKKGDVSPNSDQGAAYIFRKTGCTWVQEDRIYSTSAGDTGDEFGIAVAIHGDRALVGAPKLDSGSGLDRGAAFVFTRGGSNWAENASLDHPELANGDNFGFDVDLYSEWAIVGATGDDDGGAGAGAVYFFHWNGASWDSQGKFHGTGSGDYDAFGYSVAIFGLGTVAVIGAPGYTESYSDEGAAYVFWRSSSTWSQHSRLRAGDPASGARFGHSVDVSGLGEYVVVGAYERNGSLPDEGAVYVFRYDCSPSPCAYRQQAKLTASDAKENNLFGDSVAISALGDYLVVGARYGGAPGDWQDVGAIYVFRREGTIWTEVRRLNAGSQERTAWYGHKLALSSDDLIVGEPARSCANGDAGCGAAYLYPVGDLLGMPFADGFETGDVCAWSTTNP